MTACATRRAALASLLSVPAIAVACAQEPPPASIRVALGLERARTENPAIYLGAGRTVGVVCFDVSPVTTVVAADAGALVDRFQALLATGEFPVETAPQALGLPAPAQHAEWGACDITLFDDADANGAWGVGEAYVSAWSGGRGGYRLVAIADPRPDQPGAQMGWNLVEGGVPATYAAVPGDVIVVIEPVIEPINAQLVHRRRDTVTRRGAARPDARRRDEGRQDVCRGAATLQMRVMRARRVNVSRRRCTSLRDR